MSEIRILHLDPDPTFAEIAQTRLRLMNPAYSTIPVRDSSEFQAALVSGGFDIIFSEFGLSGYSGLSILKDASDVCPDIPFIFVSSVDKVEAAVASIQSGARGYILKSDLEGLHRVVSAILVASADLGLSPPPSGQSKERMLGGLSHELRTPLNGIVSMAGLLAETALDEKQLRYLRIIQASSQSLLRIFDDALKIPLLKEVRRPFADRPESITGSPSGSSEPLAGIPGNQFPLRILVAEDNYIGQLVICSLLEKLGQRAKVVANGKEAVEAYRKSAYDLVFMDCLMPEMDGYQAVGLIRGIEKETGKRRAMVLAMTADVLPGTPEKCAKAGMDGYLSKPILMESLEELIGMARAGAWQDALLGRDSADAPESASAGEIDLRILDRLRLLSAGDAPGMFQELVSGYIEQSEAKLGELYGHVEAGDSAQIAGVAHGLKGLSLNFGALAMARECDTLQRQCEAGAEKCRPILRKLRDIKTRTNAALSNLAGLPVPDTGSGIRERQQ